MFRRSATEEPDGETGARVALGLGSNLGDRLDYLRRAVRAVSAHATDVRASPVYETAPLHLADQPDFLNAVVLCRTRLEPDELLDELKRIEREMGRAVSNERFGPRVIDLDILLYGDVVLEGRGLTVPHPRLHERAFALVPLAELAPNWQHGGLGRSIEELLGDVSTEGVRRTEWTLETAAGGDRPDQEAGS